MAQRKKKRTTKRKPRRKAAAPVAAAATPPPQLRGPGGERIAQGFLGVRPGDRWIVDLGPAGQLPLGPVGAVLASSGEFIVYSEGTAGAAWGELHFAHGSSRSQSPEFNAVWNASESIAAQARKLLGPSEIGPLVKQLGSALANGLLGDPHGAQQALDGAQRWLRDVNTRRLKGPFVRHALLCALLAVVAGLAARWFAGEAPSALEGALTTALELAPFGVLLSALAFRKRADPPFDAFGDESDCRLEAMRRVVVGVLAAFGALLVVKSGALSSPLLEASEPYADALVAFAAGFSERWGIRLIQSLPGFEPPPEPKRPT